MILCDTDVIIEYMKGNEVAKKEIVEIGINNITVSSVSLMELFYGALNKRELNQIKKALNNFNIIHVDTGISNKAVELIEKYSKSYGLEPPDALIGATAIVRNIELFTYNSRDFKFIDGLKLYRFEEN
jgi:predicted nucleic acid-binding protein